MCLSLRLRCLLLLNGGRQGDCVRVEFWLREALLQRKPPVGVGVGGGSGVGVTEAIGSSATDGVGVDDVGAVDDTAGTGGVATTTSSRKDSRGGRVSPRMAARTSACAAAAPMSPRAVM